MQDAPNPDFYRRNTLKLFRLYEDLQTDLSWQITKLRCVERLIGTDMALWRRYANRLLAFACEEQSAGRSLSTVSVMSDFRKNSLLSRACCHLETSDDSALEAICDSLQEEFPGSARIAVHATRVQPPDPDICLLMTISWFFSKPPSRRSYCRFVANWATQYFVCDYSGLRYRFTEPSIPRVKNVANFFARAYDLPEID